MTHGHHTRVCVCVVCCPAHRFLHTRDRSHSDERLVHEASELAAYGVAVARCELGELHEEHILLGIDGKESGCPAPPPLLSF